MTCVSSFWRPFPFARLQIFAASGSILRRTGDSFGKDSSDRSLRRSEPTFKPQFGSGLGRSGGGAAGARASSARPAAISKDMMNDIDAFLGEEEPEEAAPPPRRNKPSAAAASSTVGKKKPISIPVRECV
jgi:hypothetical protein